MANQQTALITGASRGLGLALARQLARMGWALIIDARGEAALEATRAELSAVTHTIAIPGDLTAPDHRAALRAAVHSLGGLDVLVNNASTLGPSPRPNLLDYPIDELETVYRTNVIAPLALIQTLRAEFKPAARLLNITSDAGVEPYAGWGGYGSSKAAFEQLSAILANEQPEWRVYWVDPGDMRTQMHQEAFPGEDISDRDLPEASVPGLLTLIGGDLPSGRYRAKQIGVSDPGVQGLRVVLTVEDFDRALSFYRDGMKLPIADQWISETSKGILFQAGEATLELINSTQAQEIDQIEAADHAAGAVRLAFTVPDGDAAAHDLLTHGAVSRSDPVVTPWHHRNQRLSAPPHVHDPIQITLSQVVEAQEVGQ
jgi:NAD(P)-dependent dehydrogenase (short-subunit alcohol dehydrogenase family)